MHTRQPQQSFLGSTAAWHQRTLCSALMWHIFAHQTVHLAPPSELGLAAYAWLVSSSFTLQIELWAGNGPTSSSRDRPAGEGDPCQRRLFVKCCDQAYKRIDRCS
ncbi:hypothetical protein OEZ85_002252 [Tetradesmus obliquus]|uniref:Secreted protein n=1 Tax=Tetradesmus obliquus TaxID=3088 RepID=A0ABY8U2P3_TETOB|nr:hypothetical protein OEZ85_002252 [Tetradesmus obliquus]